MLEHLYTAAGCRTLDRLAIEGGVPGIELMRRAGRAVLDVVLDSYPRAGRLTICCGKGNNAGDGYVVAELALRQGLAVELVQLGDPGALTGDAATARDDALAQGLAITRSEDGQVAPAGDVLVDALLGTGLRGPVSGAYATVIERMNRSGKPVVAVDVPSGVLADTGATEGPAVRARCTVTFIGRKIGLHTGRGAALAGTVVFADLGVGDDVRRRVAGVPWCRFENLVAELALAERDSESYKQALGHLAVVGGDESMGGAPLMAAEAALRAGVGMVTVVTRGAHRNAILARRPEIMVVDAADGLAGEVLEKVDALVVGPGMGRRSWGEALLGRALALEKPAVIDADGLFLMAASGARPAAPVVVTPHTGEAATLLGSSVGGIQEDRIAAAGAVANLVGGICVLKGAGSVIADGLASEPACLGICAHGNAGMATAGMGDVLAGIVGSLLAQRKSLPATQAIRDSALLGTCLHSRAADLAAVRLGQAGLLATDILPEMVELLRSAEQARTMADQAGRETG